MRFFAASPLWEEWTSSTITAKVLLFEFADGLRDNAELLNRRDDDVFAGFEKTLELRRGLIDGVHHAGNPLHLLYGRLKLPVEHAPIGYDDDRIEDAVGIRGRAVKMREQVRQPCDRVRLAASRGVLD